MDLRTAQDTNLDLTRTECTEATVNNSGFDGSED